MKLKKKQKNPSPSLSFSRSSLSFSLISHSSLSLTQTPPLSLPSGDVGVGGAIGRTHVEDESPSLEACFGGSDSSFVAPPEGSRGSGGGDLGSRRSGRRRRSAFAGLGGVEVASPGFCVNAVGVEARVLRQLRRRLRRGEREANELRGGCFWVCSRGWSAVE